MDKVKNYKTFQKLREAKQKAQGKMETKAKEDVLAILKEEGPIDLTDTTFGGQFYLIRSNGEVCTCREVYLEDDNIFIKAEGVAGGDFVLDWWDMCQDVETFNDFMDAVYGVE